MISERQSIPQRLGFFLLMDVKLLLWVRKWETGSLGRRPLNRTSMWRFLSFYGYVFQ